MNSDATEKPGVLFFFCTGGPTRQRELKCGTDVVKELGRLQVAQACDLSPLEIDADLVEKALEATDKKRGPVRVVEFRSHGDGTGVLTGDGTYSAAVIERLKAAEKREDTLDLVVLALCNGEYLANRILTECGHVRIVIYYSDAMGDRYSAAFEIALYRELLVEKRTVLDSFVRAKEAAAKEEKDNAAEFNDRIQWKGTSAALWSGVWGSTRAAVPGRVSVVAEQGYGKRVFVAKETLEISPIAEPWEVLRYGNQHVAFVDRSRVLVRDGDSVLWQEMPNFNGLNLQHAEISLWHVSDGLVRSVVGGKRLALMGVPGEVRARLVDAGVGITVHIEVVPMISDCASLLGVPELPPNVFLGRSETANIVHTLVSSKKIAIGGMGGAGKTTLACIISRLCGDLSLTMDGDLRLVCSSLRNEFPGGVVWFEFGHNANERTGLLHAQHLLCLTTGRRSVEGINTPNNVRVELDRIADKPRTLVVLDDVWNASCLLSFPVNSSAFSLLVTLRDFSHVESWSDGCKVRLAVDDDAEPFAVAFLKSQTANITEPWLPRLAKACGFLPYLMCLCSKFVCSDTEAERFIQGQALSMMENKHYERIFNFSLRAVESHPNAPHNFNPANALLALACFPQNARLHENLLYRFWGKLFHIQLYDVKQVALLLVQSSLLLQIGGTPCYYLHDTLFEFLQCETRPDWRESHWKTVCEVYYDWCGGKSKGKGVGWIGEWIGMGHGLRWTHEIARNGPQDGFFFIHFEKITKLETHAPALFDSICFAKMAYEVKKIDPEVLLALFLCCDEINEERFLVLLSKCTTSALQDLSKQEVEVSVGKNRYYRTVKTEWSDPHVESFSLQHYVCHRGTVRMVEALSRRGGLNARQYAIGPSTDETILEISMRRPIPEVFEIVKRDALSFGKFHGREVVASTVAYAGMKILKEKCRGDGYAVLTPVHCALAWGFELQAAALWQAGHFHYSSAGSVIEYAVRHRHLKFFEELHSPLDRQLLSMTECKAVLELSEELSKECVSMFQGCLHEWNKFFHQRESEISRNGIQIFINNFSGKSITMRVCPTDTVYGLKQRIQDREGIGPWEQSLYAGAKPLRDEQTLADYGIREGTTVFIILRVKGGHSYV